MTEPERVRALAGLLDGTSIHVLELTTPEGRIVLRRGETAAARVERPAAEATEVRASCPGLFRVAHPSQHVPLAAAGREVAAGEVVGLVQVGALLMHVPAPVAGVITELLAADGQLVGYGTPLLRLEERQA